MFEKFSLKKVIISILSIILICSVTLFVGCQKPSNEKESNSSSSSSSDSSQDEDLYDPSGEEDKQTLSIEATKEVELGETVKLTVYSKNINTDLVWTSSNESVATVNEKGEITTLSVGQTVITVSAGALSASCNLTVCQTQIAPVIILDTDDVTVGVGSKYNVNVTSVQWNNKEVQVSSLNWTYKDEPQAEADKVVSIKPSADGKKVEIEGLKSGEAELTVSCSYFNNLGAKTVKVKVTNLETMKIEGLEYLGNDTYLATAYTEEYIKTVGQTDYNYQESIDFTVTVYKNGDEVQEKPEITIADPTVAKIEDGKIIGLKEGETTITCSYNDLIRTINFVCARPVIELTMQNDYVVDCYESTSIEIVQADAIKGTINKVYFSNDSDNSYTEVGTYSNGVVSIEKEKLQTSKLGNGCLKISEDNIDYVFSCGIYTMVIDDAEKLNKLNEESKKASNLEDTFDGYFVLGANLTLPENYEFNEVATEVVANGQNGFVGIFDGQGYQIDGLSIRNGGLFATLGESAVVKNVSFTNASVKNSGFISSRGAGSIQNLYIDYKDITVTDSCNGFVGTFFVNGINGKASVLNCVVLADDATYDSANKLYNKLFVIGGTTKAEGVYSDVLVTVKNVIKDNYFTNSNGKNHKNSNDSYIVERNEESVSEKFTTFAKYWDRSYWELDEISFPRPISGLSVIEHSWGSLITGTKATCNTNGTSAYKECEHCSAIAICDDNGNILSVTTNKNDLTILAGHRSLKYENGTLKCKDCLAVCQEFNLNVHDVAGSYVSDNNSIEIDFSLLSLSTVASIKLGSKTISGYTVDDGMVTIPYSSFRISEGRYGFGNQTLSITYNGSETVDLSILLKTKVIKSVNDLQDFGKIALAQSDNSQVTSNLAYNYSGYFELGANVDCNGARYTMVANSSQHVSATENGFSGVFDGKGYMISNLLVGADKMWYSGWDDTPDTCYDTYSFFGRLNGGKICNINFTGAMLNPMSSLLCSSGYGEISNIYAQISRCAIITDVNEEGQLAAYFPLSLCFSSGVSGDLSKVSISEVLVDYLSCEYLGLNKGNEYPYGSGLATYDAFGFVENEKIYNVFGLGTAEYLQNCYVVGYPGHAWNNETQFDSYINMNISSLGNFSDGMFAIKSNMLLPLSLAAAYEGLNSINVSVDKNIALPGDAIKVDLGDAKSFATFVTESDKISYSNGYIYVSNDATGKISFKFTLELANGEKVESSNITIGVFKNDGEIFDAEVETWESEDIGAVNLGSSLNSSEALSDKLGSQNIYKTNGGYGQSIVNKSVDASNYSELYFAFKATAQITLSNGNYGVNTITPNTWYVVKLAKQDDGSWTISTKGISDSSYTAFTADPQFFGFGVATFESMFRTYLWTADTYNHEVYATDVWGVKTEEYLSVEGLIDSLSNTVTTDNFNDVLAVYNAYQTLSAEQQAKVNADKVTKLNDCVGQVFALEVSTWAGANKVLDSALNETATKVGTFGSYDIYSKTGLGYGGSGIGNGNVQINNYKEVYFMFKATYPVSIFSGDWYAPKLEVNTWYAYKLVKGVERWSVYQREICGETWTELTLDNYDSLKSTEPIWFNSAFVTVTWDEGATYDVFATGMWCVGEEAYSGVERLIDELPAVITGDDVNAVLTAYNEYQALSEEQRAKVNATKVEKLNNSFAQVIGLEISAWEREGLTNTNYNALVNGTSAGTWGNLDICSVVNSGTDYIANTNVDSKAFEKLYFAFKTDKQVTLCSGDQNVIVANTWYFIKLEKQTGGSWTIFAKTFGEIDYVELIASSEFFGADTASFINMFRTYSWDGIAYNVYATDVWGKSVIAGETTGWETEGAVKLGSALNSNVALSETLGGLTIYKTNGGYGQSIVNKSIDASLYTSLYFAFKATAQVNLSNGDYDKNVITPNTWYYVKLEKQIDGSWTISVKKIGDSEYTAWVASNEFFGAGNATFESMFRTYLWTSDTYNHEVYATDVWGKSIVGSEISSWESDGAEKLGSALNSSEALTETLGGFTVYKTNGGYGQSIVNKSIDASNYTELYFAFKATAQVTLSNGDYQTNVITPNTWYFVKLEKQTDGSWTISVKKVGDSEYTAWVASNEFFGAGNATFESMFRTYLWTSDTYNHEVYATDVWGKTIVGSEISSWETEGAKKIGSAINSSEALDETLGGLEVYKTNGGYGQSIVNTSIDASNYTSLYFAFKATAQVNLSNGDYDKNVITPNIWYFVKLEKQTDGSWTISAKKVGESDYVAFTASTEFFGAGNATFETMFRTYLWTSDTYNHEVYATDVWGK